MSFDTTLFASAVSFRVAPRTADPNEMPDLAKEGVNGPQPRNADTSGGLPAGSAPPAQTRGANESLGFQHMMFWSNVASLPLDRLPMPTSDHDHPLAKAFRAFIDNGDFPCVGAKSALKKGDLKTIVARDIRSSRDDGRIHAALLGFIARYRLRPDLFQSFAVLFESDDGLDERGFEAALWERVQSVTDKDGALGHPWDRRVDDNPDNPHFSLSVAGEAFFVVGLHPHASRPARRFARPVLVFNLHDQFERLRAEGRYEKLRASILRRDEALAGTTNPMLSRHGEISEARQYSGRAVNDDWSCPFRAPPGDAA